MKAGFYIEGAWELKSNLNTLGTRVAKKVIRKAVRAGLKSLLTKAKANARSRVGGSMGSLLAKNIVIKAPKKQKPGIYALHVQMRAGVPEFVHYQKGAHSRLWRVRRGKRVPGPGKEVGRTFIPAAIEYGHGSDKESAARPFLRPAADTTRAETIRILTKQLRVGILREAIRGRYA